MYAKVSECSLFQSEVHHIGHVVPKAIIIVDLEKVRAIMERVAPKSVDE